jgi:REP element-mobilizing transposase RayT
MARKAREKSESGIYHIMLRGINRQNIFEDDEDKERFIERMKYYKTISEYKVYGYCLMDNHVLNSIYYSLDLTIFTFLNSSSVI